MGRRPPRNSPMSERKPCASQPSRTAARHELGTMIPGIFRSQGKKVFLRFRSARPRSMDVGVVGFGVERLGAQSIAALRTDNPP